MWCFPQATSFLPFFSLLGAWHPLLNLVWILVTNILGQRPAEGPLPDPGTEVPHTDPLRSVSRVDGSRDRHRRLCQPTGQKDAQCVVAVCLHHAPPLVSPKDPVR